MPEWVLDHIRAIDGDAKIGFEEELQPIDETKTDWPGEEDMKRMVPDFDYHAQVVMQSMRSAENAWQEMAIKQEVLDKNRNLEEETEADEIQEVITKMQETD